MTTKGKNNLKTAIVILFAMFSAACNKYGSGTTNPYPKPQVTPAAVTGVQLVANAKFGNILTDNNGNSLYFFFEDAAATSLCTAGCALTWPAFYKENPQIGTGLNSADFDVITRTDGAKQTTYKGWPLYYFANDSKPGDTKGDGIASLWAIAKPDYTVMLSSAQLVGLDTVKYNDQSLPGVGASQYITDGNGRTLYLFTKDTKNKNTFTHADFGNNKVWPIDTVAAVGSFPSVLDKTQFVTIQVFGKTQLVYKGHPLYHFGQDSLKRGNTRGVSFPTPGAAIWKTGNTATPAL